jgi:2-amino-4-hydroxy-6-hydroxymethyldihydropteridine diphosphokinase
MSYKYKKNNGSRWQTRVEFINLTKFIFVEKNVFLGIGTNLGNREYYLDRALEAIGASAGEVSAVSRIYETEPWGFKSKNKFLNMAVRINTDLEPEELLHTVLEIEKQLGRKRKTKRYSSRTVDIDILLYGDRVIMEQCLQVPHPKLGQRRFVLVPLCDIAAEMVHPVLMKTFARLLEECGDENKVEVVFSTPGPHNNPLSAKL